MNCSFGGFFAVGLALNKSVRINHQINRNVLNSANDSLLRCLITVLKDCKIPTFNSFEKSSNTLFLTLIIVFVTFYH